MSHSVSPRENLCPCFIRICSNLPNEDDCMDLGSVILDRPSVLGLLCNKAAYWSILEHILSMNHGISHDLRRPTS